ncbi:MAG: YicC family protein [Limnochordia bacterium]|nr:YicC family protein [Limnochordia bacterium]MDD2629902.1 YicC family protein [Limnochordia bacterium]MDD4517323.1 YicC family protein [Limnochordia bacterium]
MALFSMTGYGNVDTADAKVQVRMVNHRYLDIVVKMPSYLLCLEERVKQTVREFVQRGRVEIDIEIKGTAQISKNVLVDLALCRSYAAAANQICEQIGATGVLDINTLLGLPEVFRFEESFCPEQAWDVIQKPLTEAMAQGVLMRSREGERLVIDLQGHLDMIQKILESIKGATQNLTEQYRSKLQTRIGELLGPKLPDDLMQRLAAEVVFLAERADISEEIARIESHLSQFRHSMDKERVQGTKLDFLAQELLREFNTIGAKATDSHITGLVVEAKTVVGKIREQVQNVE